MIGIVSYGVGNVRAFASIFQRHGILVSIAATAADVRRASHLILPGVGSFDWAMERLDESGLRETLDEMVQVRQTPVLGVCVGMQMMAERSDEGRLPGLGWLPASVKQLSEPDRRYPLPHMGWNDVDSGPDPLFAGINEGLFYFLHSFHVVPRDPGIVIARTTYGGDFVCAVRHRHIAGVQFHPEKSHHWGERMLLNFSAS